MRAERRHRSEAGGAAYGTFALDFSRNMSCWNLSSCDPQNILLHWAGGLGTAETAGNGCQPLPSQLPSQAGHPVQTVVTNLQTVVSVTIDFTVSDRAQDFLIREGTDQRYGARHLKRAVERWLVQPLANLIATGQVLAGDSLLVDFDPICLRLIFLKESKETVPLTAEIALAA